MNQVLITGSNRGLGLERAHQYGQANDQLAPIYGWATEGFETPDLTEAKALLDELP